MKNRLATLDGNEAVARIAHATSEVVAIYPITPASPMGEWADTWSAAGRPNIWGQVPQVVEMQSEGGAAGAVHGALQAGALTTTFTASQGLLLMMPNLFKIAGELTPAVIHVAARSVATHALSIFGDHSDVMAVRSTGWGMLVSGSVQEAHDHALIALVASLRSRVPFLHIFDGFRTSHELNTIQLIPDDVIRTMVDQQLIEEHRQRALNSEAPVLRGTAQNPDVFFQAREASNAFYLSAPQHLVGAMKTFGALTGREYEPFSYTGHPEAERVIVLMGSAVGTAREVLEQAAVEERIGVLQVRLYRPLDADLLAQTLPTSVKKLAVLDRTKEPGTLGEPLYLDVLAAMVQTAQKEGRPCPVVIGGRYGLSSKELTPAMVRRVFEELKKSRPQHPFTLGIVDDVTKLSLPWDRRPQVESPDVFRAVFYGLGSDGTVGANKNAAKMISELSELHTQAYFVYDSKKSGAETVSHLRLSPRPIQSTYLIQRAQFVACHQFNFLEKRDLLREAETGAIFLLNAPYDANDVWSKLNRETQETILRKKLRFYVIDAHRLARELGLHGRINMIMQVCFFNLSKVIDLSEAIEATKKMIRKAYTKAGQSVVDANLKAVDQALAHLHRVNVPDMVTSMVTRSATVPAHAPDFVHRVTAMIIEGKGDLLPVSALPVDGTFPTATSRFEKRSIAHEIPIWEPDSCIQCGFCALVCPHAAIRTKAYPQSTLKDAPRSFQARPFKGKELKGDDLQLTVQVAPDDCTGCGVCVDVCPAPQKVYPERKAIFMDDKRDHLEEEQANYNFFLSIPEADRRQLSLNTIRGSQLAQPLFEYSGACAGCGETPYLKLMTQLFGDRAVVANATGCSSIFGGNLPTTPWSKDAEGHGPAWSNSLFEDNAEFGLGIALALEQKRKFATSLLTRLEQAHPHLACDAQALRAHVDGRDQVTVAEQRMRIKRLLPQLQDLWTPEVAQLIPVLSDLIPKSVWIIGGDGWAYDIGFGGLDHVLGLAHNVNILVLDTEGYSNTGGQASKATPRGAVAKFAASGKPEAKKDLGIMAMSYRNAYVAQIALGANMKQAITAMVEAESYPGPSLIIAYSTCIAHGVDMSHSMAHMKEAAAVGYWPLYRYDPRKKDGSSFHLDSRRPTQPFKDYALSETRYSQLFNQASERSEALLDEAQADINERWSYYEELAGAERHLA